MGMWYPDNKIVLEAALKKYLKEPNIKPTKLNGVIVPHAGYEFSGAVAGKAISLLNQSAIE